MQRRRLRARGLGPRSLRSLTAQKPQMRRGRGHGGERPVRQHEDECRGNETEAGVDGGWLLLDGGAATPSSSSLPSGHPASSQKNCACASRMLAHLATFAGTPCHFASDDGARLYDLSRLRRLPHEFDLIVYNFRVNGPCSVGILSARSLPCTLQRRGARSSRSGRHSA